MDKIKRILANYTKEDCQIFMDTVDMLCAKGVGNGCYRDYTVLTDILEILSACESIIKNGME